MISNNCLYSMHIAARHITSITRCLPIFSSPFSTLLSKTNFSTSSSSSSPSVSMSSTNSSSESNIFDIVIVGGGVVGAALACRTGKLRLIIQYNVQSKA